MSASQCAERGLTWARHMTYEICSATLNISILRAAAGMAEAAFGGSGRDYSQA